MTQTQAEFNATRSGFGFEKQGEGETNSWLTPPALVKLFGEFDLDPCAAPAQPWKLAKEDYRLPAQDGLILPWHGKVWCNPPYGQHVIHWVDRMDKHRNGILIIFSRCETKAWERVWASGDLFLFPFGRVSFLREDSSKAKSGTAPSAIIAYGSGCVEALTNSGIAGAYLSKADIRGGVRVPRL